jgi:hypothetical protein
MPAEWHNDPLGYADLVLNGDVKKYLATVRQFRITVAQPTGH